MTFGGYSLMWVMVMFDLPTLTKEDKRRYRHFHDALEDDGFSRLQYSVYARPCPSDENAWVHRERVIEFVPEGGEVRVLLFTDKQWGRMHLFVNGASSDVEKGPPQLDLWGDDEEENPP